MFTLKENSNKPIISLGDGKKLGEVKDLFLDPDMRQLAAVFLGKEGLVNRRSLVIPRSAVQVFGVDAWLAAGTDLVVGQESIPEGASYILIGEVRGREIQSEAGTKIGTVEDVIFNDQGLVLGFALGKVYMQGPLSERKMIAREAITSLGSKNEPMTSTLEKAESLTIPSA